MDEITHDPCAVDHHVPRKIRSLPANRNVSSALSAVRPASIGRFVIRAPADRRVAPATDDAGVGHLRSRRRRHRQPGAPPYNASLHSVSPTLLLDSDTAILRWRVPAAGRTRASAVPRRATPRCCCRSRCRARRRHRDTSFNGKMPSPRLASVVGQSPATAPVAASAARFVVGHVRRVDEAPALVDRRVRRAATRPAARCAAPGSPPPRRSARRHGCGSAPRRPARCAAPLASRASGTARSECSATPMRRRGTFHCCAIARAGADSRRRR